MLALCNMHFHFYLPLASQLNKVCSSTLMPASEIYRLTCNMKMRLHEAASMAEMFIPHSYNLAVESFTELCIDYQYINSIFVHADIVTAFHCFPCGQHNLYSCKIFLKLDFFFMHEFLYIPSRHTDLLGNPMDF